MDGVGARVIRGPDWKWGKQVSAKEKERSGIVNKIGYYDDSLIEILVANSSN